MAQHSHVNAFGYSSRLQPRWNIFEMNAAGVINALVVDEAVRNVGGKNAVGSDVGDEKFSRTVVEKFMAGGALFCVNAAGLQLLLDERLQALHDEKNKWAAAAHGFNQHVNGAMPSVEWIIRI